LGKINFHDLITSGLKNRRAFKVFISSILKNEKKSFDRIDIIFCSDPYILKLNKEFLNHNYYTDTLTFTMVDKPLVGEIYISLERVKENSKRLKILYHTELIRVIIHSCLHLCGYRDKSLISAKKMTTKQEKYLRQWLRSTWNQIGV
jgi:probable rRNA maturation factor